MPTCMLLHHGQGSRVKSLAVFLTTLELTHESTLSAPRWQRIPLGRKNQAAGLINLKRKGGVCTRPR